MRGIIDAGMQAGRMSHVQANATARDRNAGGVDLDPNQAEAQRNVLVDAMLGTLYGPMLAQARSTLEQSAEDPVQGIGRLVAGLLGSAYARVKEDGRAAPPGVMFQAGMIVSQAVGEMAGRIGLIDEQADAEIIEAGFMAGLAQFGRANAKDMSEPERARYAELISAMEESKRRSIPAENAPKPDVPVQEVR